MRSMGWVPAMAVALAALQHVAELRTGCVMETILLSDVVRTRDVKIDCMEALYSGHSRTCICRSFDLD